MTRLATLSGCAARVLLTLWPAMTAAQPEFTWSKQPGLDQYFVRNKFVPKSLQGRLDTPITDKAFLAFLNARLATFTFNGETIAISPGSTADLGAPSPMASSTLTAIPMEKNPALLTVLEKTLRFDREKDLVSAAFLVRLRFEPLYSQARRGIYYSYVGRMFVTVTTAGNTRTRSYEFTPSSFNVAFDTARMTAAVRARANAQLPAALAQREEAQFQGYRRLPTTDADGKVWTWKEIQELGRLVRLTEAEIGRYRTLGEYVVLVRIADDDGDDEDETVKGEDDTVEAAAVPATRVGKVVVGKIIVLPTGAATSVGLIAAIAAITGIGTNADSPYEPEGTLRYGPPEGFNEWTCNTFCTNGECRNCCNSYFWGEMAWIGGFAASCHTASDWCPWCHAGCAAAEIAFTVAAAWTRDSCMDNCAVDFSDDSARAGTCP